MLSHYYSVQLSSMCLYIYMCKYVCIYLGLVSFVNDIILLSPAEGSRAPHSVQNNN